MKIKLLKWCWPLLLLTACGSDDENIKPELQPITESVYASLTVEPKDLYNVYAAAPGIIDSLLVEEGALVNTDEKLAQIVAQNPELNAASARLNVELAQEKYEGQASLLASIREEIEIAKSQLKLDSLNFVRQKNLWEERIGSEVEFEQRKLQYERTQNNLTTLKQKYAQTQTELENSYRRAKNALAQAQTNLSDFSVNSKINGKVYALNKEAGEMILQQEVLAQIGHAEKFVVEMAIDEVDVARIKNGQSVVVTLDAYPEESFDAEITKIYPQKNVRTQTFKVEGEFVNPPQILYAGMSGEANILISKKDRALTIPIEYLANGNVVTEDGEVPVETGIRTMERVEIISGIDSSTTLYKP